MDKENQENEPIISKPKRKYTRQKTNKKTIKKAPKKTTKKTPKKTKATKPSEIELLKQQVAALQKLILKATPQPQSQETSPPPLPVSPEPQIRISKRTGEPVVQRTKRVEGEIRVAGGILGAGRQAKQQEQEAGQKPCRMEGIQIGPRPNKFDEQRAIAEREALREERKYIKNEK